MLSPVACRLYVDLEIALDQSGDRWQAPGTPDVVFFGESVPGERVRRAMAAIESCDAMLVVGSSQSRPHKSQRPRYAQGHRPVRDGASRVRGVAATAASRPR
jgi:hypothetical protein